MSGFASEWLDLREAADKAARDPRLLGFAARLVADGSGKPIVDLGCGTGSTARAMASHLPADTRWRLVDNDPALLVIAAQRVGGTSETVVADLLSLDSLPIKGAGLVTGSALFDLVSARWIEDFVARLAAEGVPLYAALTYDGRSEWSPPHPQDGPVLAAFNRHQRTDKGLGAAMGPDAPAALVSALEARGYRVETAASDWRLGKDAARLVEEHARGVAAAAAEAGLDPRTTDAWLAFRTAEAANGEAIVGHLDILAKPAG